jgi:hypothetical protein
MGLLHRDTGGESLDRVAGDLVNLGTAVFIAGYQWCAEVQRAVIGDGKAVNWRKETRGQDG